MSGDVVEELVKAAANGDTQSLEDIINKGEVDVSTFQ